MIESKMYFIPSISLINGTKYRKSRNNVCFILCVCVLLSSLLPIVSIRKYHLFMNDGSFRFWYHNFFLSQFSFHRSPSTSRCCCCCCCYFSLLRFHFLLQFLQQFHFYILFNVNNHRYAISKLLIDVNCVMDSVQSDGISALVLCDVLCQYIY